MLSGPKLAFLRREQFAEKLDLRCSAPKGASQYLRTYGIAKAMP
jgi:hypothetical protein